VPEAFKADETITNRRLLMPVISRNVPSYALPVQGNTDGELLWILLLDII